MAAPIGVLLAEHEALIAFSFADLLEVEGHAVAVALDGAAALAAARRMGASLGALVTDLRMPGLRGEDLIRAVRADRPGLPIVVVTGSPPPGGEAVLRRLAGGHGPLLLLPKPVCGTRVAAALRRAATAADGTGKEAPPLPATGMAAHAAP